jgi:exosortase/archaeosortase family protein
MAEFDMRSLLVLSLITIAILIALYGGIGYLVAGRRLSQPPKAFLLRYVTCFLLLLFFEIALVYLCPSFHNTLRNLTATLVGVILTTAGVSHSVSGPAITLQNPSLAFNINAGCLGGMLFWTFIGLVLAEPRATIRHRLAGILVGLAILMAFNFIRITLSIYLEWLTGVSIHGYFYIFNMIFVLLVWLGWLWTIRRRPTRLAGAMP